jgi:hypothetical protein
LPSFGSHGPESWQELQAKVRPPQCELFGARLSELLNPEHPLYVLAERFDWSQFEAASDACYADELGRPGVNTRLMVGLLYLKHADTFSRRFVAVRRPTAVFVGSKVVIPFESYSGPVTFAAA